MMKFWRKLLRAGKPEHIVSGEWGEQQAVELLEGKGWKILGQRVRSGSREEIDIVARSGDLLVFVEVKFRRSEVFGRPIESVNRNKRRLLCRAAARYLVKLKNPRVCYRFDVVEVVGSPGVGVKKICHTENAFPMDRKYSI
jgi:putative endonuclease